MGLTYNEKKQSFCEILRRDKFIGVHIRNFPFYDTEIYKVKTNIAFKSTKKIFRFHHNTIQR